MKDCRCYFLVAKSQSPSNLTGPAENELIPSEERPWVTVEELGEPLCLRDHNPLKSCLDGLLPYIIAVLCILFCLFFFSSLILFLNFTILY